MSARPLNLGAETASRPLDFKVLVENKCVFVGLGRVPGKGEGPWENLEKVQVLWICRGVGVFSSRVIRDEYRNWGAQNDRQMMPDISS